MRTTRKGGGTDLAAGLHPQLGGILEKVGKSGGGTGTIPYVTRLSSASLHQGFAGDGGTGTPPPARGGVGEGRRTKGRLFLILRIFLQALFAKALQAAHHSHRNHPNLVTGELVEEAAEGEQKIQVT